MKRSVSPLNVESALGLSGVEAAKYRNSGHSESWLAFGRVRGGSFAWSLVLGLMLFAQTLGLVHSFVHNPQVGSGHEAELRHLHDAGADLDLAQGWLDKLFASHEEDGDHCRVFDHQGHSVLMTTVAALALPSVLHAFVPIEWVGCCLVASAAPFDARGPPFSL